MINEDMQQKLKQTTFSEPQIEAEYGLTDSRAVVSNRHRQTVHTKMGLQMRVMAQI